MSDFIPPIPATEDEAAVAETAFSSSAGESEAQEASSLSASLKTFEELGLGERLLKAIDEQGYEHPMPVQEQVIPWLLNHDEGDLVALAQTGTGKTAAYGLPLLECLQKDGESLTGKPKVLILSPTRELCLQIADDLKGFARYMPEVRVLAVYGGANIEPQIRALKHGVDIIVATPGRLVDLMTRKRVAVLDEVRYVVLDEADEMLSMGFQEDLDTILDGVPGEHRTLLFSATMSREIERIAKKYLRNAHEIQVGSRNEGAENVNHIYYMVQAKDKYLALKRVVDYYPRIYAIIFCRTRLETQEVADNLIRDGYNADALHGELSQQQRDLTMQRFRQHRVQLLVATDVAARGLDVDDLTHVINYGMPDDTENYTHRSGRTGRAGKKGTSISIIHSRERSKIRQTERIIQKDFVLQHLPEPHDICGKQLYHVIDEIERVEVDEEQIAPFMDEVKKRWEWLDKNDLVKRIVSREFGRFLRYYANAPEINEVAPTKEKEKGKRKGEGRNNGRQRGNAEEGYTRLFLSVSKMDGFFAKEIIRLINDNVKGGKVEIGRIDLLRNISFVEVAEEDADRVLRGLKGKRVHGREITIDRADTPNEHRSKKGGRSAEAARGGRSGGKKDGKGKKDDREKKSSYPTDFYDDAPKKASKKEKKKDKKNKRAARGTQEDMAPQGKRYTKDDWMKFLHPDQD